jgi:hypothetical protein
MTEPTTGTSKVQPASAGVEPVVPGIQPEPPRELNADEAAEWNYFMGHMPADWFPAETRPLLAQLCRHICQSRWIGATLQEVRAGLTNTADLDSLKRVEALVRMHDREGKAMQNLMIKLRLSSTQRIVDERVARAQRAEQPPADKPWAPVPAAPRSTPAPQAEQPWAPAPHTKQ